jgi:hypothetical protein
MKGIQQRELHELYLRSNLQRLSDETLARIVEEIEEEVEIAIEKELQED